MLPRRALGRQLRKMRLRQGMTQSAAARVAEISPQSYGRLEDGRPTKVTDMVINALCNSFSSSDEERGEALALARDIRKSLGAAGGWWQANEEAVPSTFNYFINLEESATAIVSWQTSLVPGMLQTREYRRALLWAEYPDMPPREIEMTLDIVAGRQELLDRTEFRFDALVDESVLHRSVGGSAVIADQLSHLLRTSQRPNVTLRVVGREARDPLGLVAGPFVLFDLPPLPTSQMRQSSVVYAEGYFGKVYIERDSEVATYSQLVQRLRRVAHSDEKSRDMVLGALKEWEQ